MTPLFLLGGHDLEMLTIRELLQANNACFIDMGLGWGAVASAYQPEIEVALKAGKTPVLVELVDDLGLEGEVVSIDHHGPLAGAEMPTSLHQVFALLKLPPEDWTRRMELVAANDRGHIRGMLAVGATLEEISAIRAADRAAQGTTQEQEEQAVAAVRVVQALCNGRLTVVRLPHNRAAAVADRLAPELGGGGSENLLVISPDELNFYGSGQLVHLLDRTFPGGWYGGSLPERGFWGYAGTPLPDLLTLLQRELA